MGYMGTVRPPMTTTPSISPCRQRKIASLIAPRWRRDTKWIANERLCCEPARAPSRKVGVVGTRGACHVRLTQGVLPRTSNDPPDPSAPLCAPIQSRGLPSSR